MKRALACFALAACSPRVVELGKVDAAVDARADAPNPPACRCRITPCRVIGDCAATGGTCGADFYCTGDFGPCATTAQCMATVTDSVCTVSATSITPCP